MIFNAVEKLRELGERLAPPHMKPLQGEAAGGPCELRPRQGRSDWRAALAPHTWCWRSTGTTTSRPSWLALSNALSNTPRHPLNCDKL